ncbi:hypothetical protein BHM03_00043073 [Ensete ventricosum]|nr:hypothetical protein BHM03_00043073 [Ensete ventricosum]
MRLLDQLVLMQFMCHFWWMTLQFFSLPTYPWILLVSAVQFHTRRLIITLFFAFNLKESKMRLILLQR